MPRPRTSVVYICLAVVVLAAFLPGVSAVDYAVPKPLWVLLPDLSDVAIRSRTIPNDEQPSSLLSLVSSRAPPQLSVS